MPTCVNDILKSIQSDCVTALIGGLENKAWAFNRKNLASFVQTDNKLKTFVFKATKQLWPLYFSKGVIDAGHDSVVADKYPTRYKHTVMLSQFEKLAADLLMTDNMDDICFIVETKDKGTAGDGTFFVYGFECGLSATEDTRRHLANNGTRMLTYSHKGEDTEKNSALIYFNTSYATTLAEIEALETPAV